METPHLAGVLGAQLDDLLVGLVPQVQGPSEPPQVGLGGRHEVRAPQPVQLDAVLEGAQDLVGVGEHGGVRSPHVATGRQRGEGVERGARVQALVGAAVDQLEQLDGELHVAQTTGTELELAGGLGGGDVLLDATAHRLHVVDEVLPGGRLPDHRLHRGEVLRPQRGVAGQVTRLEQGLELPRLGPALVVGTVAGHGAHERPLLALRPQRRVDRPQAAVGGRVGARVHHPGRHPRRDVERGGLVGALDRLRDEDDVDVGDVVELATAGLAHADDGEAAGLPLVTQLVDRDPDRALERRAGEVGQGAPDLGQELHGVLGRRVAGGDAEQLAPVADPQGVLRLEVAGVSDLGEQGLGPLLRRHLPGVDGITPLLGVGDEMVDERRRDAHRPDDPGPRRRVVPQGGEQRLDLVASRLDDPDEPEQRAVGVGGSCQGRDEVVTDLGERRECGVGQQGLGPTGVVEASSGDAGSGSGGWCHAVLTVAAADFPARRG